MSTVVSHNHGFQWKSAFGCPQPVWTVDPNMGTIESFCRAALHITTEAKCEVSFYAEGSFNRLYRVSAPHNDYIFRVSLPIHNPHKVASEVATTRFLQNTIGLPVPTIIAFDSNNNNQLGFAWILMTYVGGVTLRSRWRKMTWEKKESLVREVATAQAKIYEHHFTSIGSLYPQPTTATSQHRPSLIFIISVALSMITMTPNLLLTCILLYLTVLHFSKYEYDVFPGRMTTLDLVYEPPDAERGPFPNTNPWLTTRLDRVVVTNQEYLDLHGIDKTPDSLKMITFATTLIEYLPKLFPVDICETTHIRLHDLHEENILVDSSDNLLAIVDLEMVGALPTWLSCDYPRMLISNLRKRPPQQCEYGTDNWPDGVDPPEENEGLSQLYWRDLLEFEKSKLRGVFLEEMERV